MADSSPTRVLVTGASGHLGRAVRSLIESPAFSTIEPVYWVSPASMALRPADTVVDLANLAAVERGVEAARPDAIIHLAALTGGACEQDVDRTRAINVDATRTLAASGAAAGVTRFVLAGTSAVYGDQYDRPVTEGAAIVGTSAYARSKAAAEDALGEIASGGREFRAITLRIFNIYGPIFPESLVSRLLRSTAREPVPLRGPANFVRDYVHQRDVAVAALRALDAPSSEPLMAVNVASGVPTTNEGLVETIGRTHTVHFVMTEGERSYSCADISRARELFDFRPVGLEAGIV